jgi:hypothetical protein
MIEQREHKLDRLDGKLDELDSKKLKSEVINRIQEINASKKKITILAKTSIEKIERSSKSAIDELNDLSKIYSNLLSLKKSSKSLKLKVLKIIGTTMVIKIGSLNIDPNLEQAFNQNLITFVEKNQKKEVIIDNDFKKINKNNDISKGQELEKKSKELEIKKKQDINKNIQDKSKKQENFSIKGEVFSKKFNAWSLADKQEYMESLKIDDYQDAFSRSGIQKFPTVEILLSDDSKYSFICNI